MSLDKRTLAFIYDVDVSERSDEDVILIGYNKIACRRRTNFHFFPDKDILDSFLTSLKKVDTGNYAVITRFDKHYVPIYIRKEGDSINLFVCDSVPTPADCKVKTHGFIKRNVEDKFSKYRVIYSDVQQQADKDSCATFALNTLTHMVSLDKEGILFPQNNIGKDRVYEPCINLPAILLKLTQIDRDRLAIAYADDTTTVNKGEQTLTQLLSDPFNNMGVAGKAADYRFHVTGLLKQMSSEEIERVREAVTKTQPYVLSEIVGLGSARSR